MANEVRLDEIKRYLAAASEQQAQAQMEHQATPRRRSNFLEDIVSNMRGLATDPVGQTRMTLQNFADRYLPSDEDLAKQRLAMQGSVFGDWQPSIEKTMQMFGAAPMVAATKLPSILQKNWDTPLKNQFEEVQKLVSSGKKPEMWSGAANDLYSFQLAADKLGIDVDIRLSAHSASKYLVAEDRLTGETMTIRISNHPQTGFAKSLHGESDLNVSMRKSLLNPFNKMLEKFGKGRQMTGAEFFNDEVSRFSGAARNNRVMSDEEAKEKATAYLLEMLGK